MTDKLKELQDSEEYKELISTRSKTKWPLAVLMLVVYYGFIMILAFHDKTGEIFAQKVGEGHTSVGIAVGLGVILFSFIVTGIYVRKANKVLEPLTQKLHEKAGDLS